MNPKGYPATGRVPCAWSQLLAEHRGDGSFIRLIVGVFASVVQGVYKGFKLSNLSQFESAGLQGLSERICGVKKSLLMTGRGCIP